MATATGKLEFPKIVPLAEWVAARKELLKKEKEFSRLRDELSSKRRELPWEKVEKQYVFDSLKGKETLADLFGGKSQLIVYHFMFGPGWKEGCPSCSFLADHFDGSIPHLAARDVTLVAVSRATLPEIEAFKKRMGWKFKWVSSNATDFNFDYQVSVTKEEREQGKVYYNYVKTEFPSDERPGASVFYKNAVGEVFHTYSTYARGLDILLGAYNFLDLTPKGRDEGGLAHTMAWVRHHDKYADGYTVDAKQPYKQPATVDHSCAAEQQGKRKAIPMLEPVLSEIREEAVITKRVLDRVPADKLSWKPHRKSMSLGQLALHIASVPGNLSKMLQQDGFEVNPANFEPPAPKNIEEIHAAFDQSLRAAEEFLNSMSEQSAQGGWRLTVKGKHAFTKPRVGVVRAIMMNHLYHHRGQLSVYLRLLDVPVPVIYGRSADEDPFA